MFFTNQLKQANIAPRQSAKITYPSLDVLFVILCNVIGGAEGWIEIHDYAQTTGVSGRRCPCCRNSSSTKNISAILFTTFSSS